MTQMRIKRNFTERPHGFIGWSVILVAAVSGEQWGQTITVAEPHEEGGGQEAEEGLEVKYDFKGCFSWPASSIRVLQRHMSLTVVMSHLEWSPTLTSPSWAQILQGLLTGQSQGVSEILGLKVTMMSGTQEALTNVAHYLMLPCKFCVTGTFVLSCLR